MTGFFVSDFLFSELQEVRLVQRLPERTKLYNGLFEIPTFNSIMELAQSYYASSGRTVGIYPELKHPSFFHSLGFEMEDLLLEALVAGGYEVFGADVPRDLNQVLPVVIQCFEPPSLQYLATKTKIPLILLLEAQKTSFWTDKNMASIAAYASAIGPEKKVFGASPYSEAMDLIGTVRKAGLKLHPYTFRADRDIVARFNKDFNLELMYYYCCLGMDGLFSEFPDRSREVLDVMGNYTQWFHASGQPAPTNQPICNINCENPV